MLRQLRFPTIQSTNATEMATGINVGLGARRVSIQHIEQRISTDPGHRWICHDGFPMVFPWFPMIFPWFPQVFLYPWAFPKARYLYCGACYRGGSSPPKPGPRVQLRSSKALKGNKTMRLASMGHNSWDPFRCWRRCGGATRGWRRGARQGRPVVARHFLEPAGRNDAPCYMGVGINMD